MTLREIALKLWKPLAAGLVLRVVILLVLRYRTDLGDAHFYSVCANNILEHGTYSSDEVPPLEPSTYRPPLYSAFVALVRLIFGTSVFPLQIVQVLLGLATASIVGAAAFRISARLGRWSIWALALCPSDAAINGALLGETLVTFLLSLGLTIPFFTTKRWRWPAIGFALGLAALTRDVYMLLIPTLACAACFVFRPRGSRRRQLVTAALIVTCSLAMIAPWTVRNYEVKHQFIPLSRSVFYRSLWQGTWVIDNSHAVNDALGLPKMYPPWAFELPGEEDEFVRAQRLDDVPRDALYRQMFRRRMREMPGKSLLAWVRRAPLVWVNTTRLDIFEFSPRVLPRGSPLYYLVKAGLYGLNVIVVGLGFLGIGVAARARNRRQLWFALPVLYSIGIFLPLDLIEVRYTQPVYGCLIVSACFATRYLRVLWKKRAIRLAQRPATA